MYIIFKINWTVKLNTNYNQEIFYLPFPGAGMLTYAGWVTQESLKELRNGEREF